MSFPPSEHHYQLKKLKHDLGEEAFLLLTEEDMFKAMHKAKELIPDEKVSEEWKAVAYDEMLATNQLKYATCEDA